MDIVTFAFFAACAGGSSKWRRFTPAIRCSCQAGGEIHLDHALYLCGLLHLCMAFHRGGGSEMAMSYWVADIDKAKGMDQGPDPLIGLQTGKVGLEDGFV